MMTGEDKGRVFTNSENYAGQRMLQLARLGLEVTGAQREIVHDALMAAFQAGAVQQADGITVDALIARMADI